MTNPLHDALYAPLAGQSRALMHLPGGKALSADVFHTMVARAAGALTAAGLRPGDRLALQVPKSAEALALIGGAIRAGVVFLPLNTAYTAEEVAYFVRDSGAALLIADPAQAEALAPVAQAAGARLMTLALGAAGEGSFAEAMTAAPETAPVARDVNDLAGLLYTSGTTGRSKGAMLTHGNLLSNAEVLARAWRFTDRDVLLHALPVFHTHGLFVATNTVLLTGGAMLLHPGFNLDAVIADLPRATAMMGVPTFYTRLLADPRFTRELVAHMRLFTSGSAPLLAETHEAFHTRTGHRILERYGMTETNMNTSNPYDGDRRAGTVGLPLAGVEVIVTDPETGTELPQGETGMIEVRGPNVFAGYWNMPDKTAEEKRANGYFITGDLGRFDGDGYLHIVGRAKDLIISGGYNVYPKEVELLLDEAPGVLESAVIGVPHPDFGEAVLGVVVPSEGAAPDAATLEALLQDRLARYKQPKAYEILPALPRNTMGKVQKAELRARFAQRFTNGGPA